MTAMRTRPIPAEDTAPVDDFSVCHEGILTGLRSFSFLPQLAHAVQRAREIARQTLDMMDKAVMQHHAEEEQELFPAVLRSALPGAERERVQALVWQLTDEHRDIETLWKRLRPEVKRIAAGTAADLRADAVALLTEVYREHAQREEREFLPLARDILGRDSNHMAALGMAIHLRHAPIPIGYM